jgi:hypothetical protein
MGHSTKSAASVIIHQRRWLLALVTVSFVWFLLMAAFRSGLDATAYSTSDSVGRTMGFNGDFSTEHYQIIITNISLRWILVFLSPYDWLFAAVHGLLIYLLRKLPDEKWIIRFCLVQPIISPSACLACRCCRCGFSPLPTLFWITRWGAGTGKASSTFLSFH